MIMAFGLFHMACFCTKTLKSAESTERAFTFSEKKSKKKSNAVFARSKPSVERWTLHTLNRRPHWSSSWSLGTNFSVVEVSSRVGMCLLNVQYGCKTGSK